MITVIDFETYYDQQYSLSKLTTEEYIRGDSFETIGVAVRVDDGPTRWFSGTHEEIKAWLDQFDWQSGFVVAHNMAFDGAILSWRFDIHPKILADTLSMARALHGVQVGGSLAKLATHYGLGEKGTEVINALGKRRKDFTPEELNRYGQYCCNDVDLTYALFQRLVDGYPKDELRLIDQIMKMYTEPVLELDEALLITHLIEVQATKEALLAKVGSVDKKSIMSNPQFAKLLEDRGVVVPMKTSPTTGKPTYAFAKTDQGLKDLLEHPDVEVQALVAARLGAKSTLEETRTQRFLSIASRGKLPIPLKYYAAHTGRLGGCLVADTEVTVYNQFHGVETKRIVDVLLDDLVWDGEAFVPHEGVVFSGFSEVIEWDGVRGTADHVVFTNSGEISLREAMQGQHPIKVGESPTQDDVDAARVSMENHEG